MKPTMNVVKVRTRGILRISRTYCALQWKRTRIKSIHAQLRDLANNKICRTNTDSTHRYKIVTKFSFTPNIRLYIIIVINIVLESKNLLVLTIAKMQCE